MEAMTSSCPLSSPFTPKSLQLRPFLLLHRSSTVRYNTRYLKSKSLKVNSPGTNTGGKGFGNILDKKSQRNAKGKGSRAAVCPCGGGDFKSGYENCCKFFHDGAAVEPDATTLMKARFAAYANGVVDYIVKTTHPHNPDFQGADRLADDVQATCARLLFTKLEILNSEIVSENEASVLFRVTYLSRNSNKGSKNFLIEKSLFLREGEHWFYKEKLPLTTIQTASTNSNFIQAELARKAYNSKRPLPIVKLRKK